MIRRKCSIKPEHQVVLSEFVGKAYTQNPDGTWAFQEGAADAMLEQPAFGQVLRNLAGALNEGELYDDAAPADRPSILDPYGSADELEGRSAPLDKAGVALPVQGPCQMSVVVADGIKAWIGYAVAPGIYTEGQASASNGTAMVNLPAGEWWVSAKLDPGASQSSTPANLWRGKA